MDETTNVTFTETETPEINEATDTEALNEYLKTLGFERKD